MTSTFSDLGIADASVQQLISLGITTPTPVQAEAIPLLLAGNDVIAQAQTGTGKTAAFALPIIQGLDRTVSSPQVLLLAPTRELAMQVAESFTQLVAKDQRLNVTCLVGGSGYREQLKQLKLAKKNTPHVVVGTPGRVMDHMNRGSLVLDKLTTFVLDEADEMLRMGFIEDVEWILDNLPKKRQMALFSATMPSRIRQIAVRYLNEPKQVTIKSKTATVETVSQRFLFANFQQKDDALQRILETESYLAVIVFARTKQLTEEIAVCLQSEGYKARAINGDIPQVKRIQTVDELKKGKIDILVATDVAARGLDIERISLVINYDLPFDVETYVHRIGRTGRAGREGHALSFITPKEARLLHLIEKHTKQKITKMQVPSNEEIQDLRNQRFIEKMAKVLGKGDLTSQRQLIHQYVQEEGVDVYDVAAALVKMSQKPLKKFKPAKESTSDGRRDRKERGNRREFSGKKEFGNKREFGNKKEFGGKKEFGSKKAKLHFAKDIDLELFRIEVGKRDGAQARNIVGAIANEAGIDSKHIDDLTIKEDYSTVKLPEGMPKKVFKDLAKAWVCGKQLELKRVVSV